MKNSKKVSLLKMQLSTAIVLLVAILIGGFFVFSPVSLRQTALALSGDYDRFSSGDNAIDQADWDLLDEDFVALDNGTANNLTVNDITLNGTCTGTGCGGGDIFTNWGRGDCPGGTTLLYSGYAFGKKWDEPKGSGEILCIASPSTAGPPSGSAVRDKLWPIGTGAAAYTPPGIPTYSEMRCAVCYNPGGVCYEAIGVNTCNVAASFNVAYVGYMMGGVTGLDNPLNENNNSRSCVNGNFDGSVPNSTLASVYAGTEIIDNSDVPSYTIDSFINCAICCN